METAAECNDQTCPFITFLRPIYIKTSQIMNKNDAKIKCKKKKKMSSFKSNKNIYMKEDGSYYVVSANKASSVTQ